MIQWLKKLATSAQSFFTVAVEWAKTNPRQVLLYSLIVIVLIESSTILGEYLEGVEQWYVTNYQSLISEERTDSRIQIVSIDNNTIANPAIRQVFGKYPFPRHLYGYMVRYLSRANAELVFMDLSFDGGKDEEHPEHDQFFVDSVTESKVPVFSALLGTARAEEIQAEEHENDILFDWQKIPYGNGFRPDNSSPASEGEKSKNKGIGFPCTSIFSHPLSGLLHSPMRFAYVNDMIPDAQGRARYAIMVQGNHGCAKPWVVPTAPMVMMHYRLMHRLGLDAMDAPLMPIYLTESGESQKYQLQFLHPETKSIEHRVNLYAFTPLIRWYGSQSTLGRKQPSTKHTSCKNRYKRSLLGPLLKEATIFLCHNNMLGPFGEPEVEDGDDSVVFGAYEEKYVLPYQETSLWDVVYSELVHSCSQKKSAQEPACLRFNRLNKKGEVKGHLIPPDQFKDMTVIVGTTYQNADGGDVHTSIYGVNKYPGVYILANIFDNVLHNDFVVRLPGWVKPAIAVALSVLVALVCFYRPVMFSSFFALVLLGAYSLVVISVYKHYNIWIYWAVPVLSAVAVYILSFGIRYWTSEYKKRQLRFAFGKYVSKNVMHSIEQNPDAVSLGGQRKRLTMMFTDIRGFTSYSESNPPEEVQAVLTRYFKVMHGIILQQHRGVINKLIGDAIMAYWGFPLARKDDPLDAVRAAMAMKEAMVLFQADPKNPPLRIGVGLHTGDAVIGNVGSEDFMDFTVIGDAVNLAARLESETKVLLPEQPCAILISETTYDAVKHAIKCRDLGEITVRGKTQPIRIYEPLSEIDA